MEAEIKRVRRVLEEGNMAGITHGHRVLKDQLEKYCGGLDTVKDGRKCPRIQLESGNKRWQS
jgi:hypothetical protein